MVNFGWNWIHRATVVSRVAWSWLVSDFFLLWLSWLEEVVEQHQHQNKMRICHIQSRISCQTLRIALLVHHRGVSFISSSSVICFISFSYLRKGTFGSHMLFQSHPFSDEINSWCSGGHSIRLSALHSDAWYDSCHSNLPRSTDGWRKCKPCIAWFQMLTSRCSLYQTRLIMFLLQEEKAKMIQTVLFVAGINTLFQTLFGTRLPAIIGASYTFVPSIISIIMARRYHDIVDPIEVSYSACKHKELKRSNPGWPYWFCVEWNCRNLKGSCEVPREPWSSHPSFRLYLASAVFGAMLQGNFSKRQLNICILAITEKCHQCIFFAYYLF